MYKNEARVNIFIKKTFKLNYYIPHNEIMWIISQMIIASRCIENFYAKQLIVRSMKKRSYSRKNRQLYKRWCILGIWLLDHGQLWQGHHRYGLFGVRGKWHLYRCWFIRIAAVIQLTIIYPAIIHLSIYFKIIVLFEMIISCNVT